LRPRGFTLIEILVVIIIIAVMSSVAVPAYFRFLAHSSFVQSVQQTVSLLGWARNAAVETGTNVSVQFDLHAGTITVSVPQRDTSSGPSRIAADMPTAMQDQQDASATVQPRVSPLGEDITVTGLTVIPGAAGSDPTNGGANPLPADNQAQSGNQAQQAINFYSDGTADNAQFALVSTDGFHASVAVVPTTGRAIVGDE
jgi:prepilin-type N-terminal cleavage/methylation domain-containing protein